MCHGVDHLRYSYIHASWVCVRVPLRPPPQRNGYFGWRELSLDDSNVRAGVSGAGNKEKERKREGEGPRARENKK